MKTFINRYDVHIFERLISKLVKSTDVPQNVSFVSCSGTDRRTIGLLPAGIRQVVEATLGAGCLKVDRRFENGKGTGGTGMTTSLLDFLRTAEPATNVWDYVDVLCVFGPAIARSGRIGLGNSAVGQNESLEDCRPSLPASER